MAENPKRKYPDLRYKLIRGLINYEKLQRKAHWLKQAAEWTSKAIVSLEFTFDVIKSVRQATQLEGIGDTISAKLRELSKDKRFSTHSAGRGKFVSSAPALLVALYMLQEAIGENDILQVNKALVPEMQLRKAAKMLSEEEFIDKEGFCQATWRLHVLANRDLLKKRSRDKLPVYELLPSGEVLAKELMASVGLQGASFLQVISGLVPELPAVEAQPHLADVAHDHLYTNDDDSDGVVLYVDMREWGGDRLNLIALCQQLDNSNVRYATCHLATGDYGWGWKCRGRKVELPLLIERKSVVDLADSVKDGRYARQKERMITWKQKYTDLQQEATLIYVVEGDPEMHVHRCADGCGGVGRCGNPNLYEIQALIRELDTGSEFTLIQTKNRGATIDALVAMTRELQMRINNGDFHNLLRHAETLELDPNYSKLTKARSAAKRGKKATKVAKKQKTTAGEGANGTDDAVWDGLIPRDLLTPQPEMNREVSPDATRIGPKKQRKRKTKALVVDIDDIPPGSYVPYGTDTQNQRFQARGDLPLLVNATGSFEPRCEWSSYHRSASTASSSHCYPEESFTFSHLEEQSMSSRPYEVEEKPFMPAAAAGTSDKFSDDAIRLPQNPNHVKAAEVPRTKTKVRKVHEITWSDDEDLPYPSHTTTLSNPDDTDASDNKWWHANSMPFLNGHMVKVEPAGDHGSVTKTEPGVDYRSTPTNSTKLDVDYESALKTEPGVGEYPPSPGLKQDVCGVVKEQWSAELQSIRSILPDADEDLARRKLDLHDGNVEAALSALLDSM